jgi:hypothetical protein
MSTTPNVSSRVFFGFARPCRRRDLIGYITGRALMGTVWWLGVA